MESAAKKTETSKSCTMQPKKLEVTSDKERINWQHKARKTRNRARPWSKH